MKNLCLTLAILTSISFSVYADEPCEQLADADQQFITDLCVANNNFKDRPSHMEKICYQSFISETKKGNKDKKPFTYKMGGRNEGFSKYISYENISDYPVAFSMTCTDQGLSFETLIINHEQLGVIPDSLGGLTNLKVLDLIDNEIAALPDTTATLVNLEELRLSFNRFSQLPTFLSSMPNLRNLQMDGNQIFSVKPADVETLLQHVITLNLTNNRLPKDEKRDLKARFDASEGLWL